MNLARPGVSWTYPYEFHPIYQQNQTIYCTFFGARVLTNETIEVQIADLHYSSFIGAVDVQDGPVIKASAIGKGAVNTSIGPSAEVKPARERGIISYGFVTYWDEPSGGLIQLLALRRRHQSCDGRRW